MVLSRERQSRTLPTLALPRRATAYRAWDFRLLLSREPAEVLYKAGATDGRAYSAGR